MVGVYLVGVYLTGIMQKGSRGGYVGPMEPL